MILLFAAALNLLWIPQTSNTNVSLRGLSVASPTVVWASGSAGTFLRTTDGGAYWQAAKVPDAEKLDFRDVQAFDDKTALLMAAGTGQASRVYKTIDAGAHWTLTLQNPDASGFFDAFAFWDRKHGILLGDPVNGKFTIFVTDNGGDTWTRATQPPALPGEGAFAASGTCITVQGTKNAWFGTGGLNVARVFHTSDRGKTWTASSTPLAQAAASAGVFSVLFTDGHHGYAIGGDYQKPTASAQTLALTHDSGASWTSATIPSGFRSAIFSISKPNLLLSVGTSGSDFSADEGHTWKNFSTGNFNVVAGVRSNVWAAGPKGSLAKLSLTTQ
jgi:photosystem II stability/assembly factor-like uncharacterized protein